MIRPLAPDVKRALDSVVGGERVLWTGQPDASRQRLAFGIWLFAIPWTLFSLFWESMALMPWMAETNTPSSVAWSFGIIMPIFGIPFIVIGFWMLWQPIRIVRKTRDTVYALTERRLIEVIVGNSTSVKTVLVDRIGPIERQEARDGWGVLRIQTHSRIDSDGDRMTERFEMIGIPDVAGLERRILELQPR